MKYLIVLALFLLGCANQKSEETVKPFDMIQAPPKYKYDCSGLNCKNLLSIGDSISLGYLNSLNKELGTQYNISHPTENCRNSWYTLQNIDLWLSKEQTPDVIVWNNGLWNVVTDYLSNQPGQIKEQYGTSLEQYESDLRAIAIKLKSTNARIIFLTTTTIDVSKQGQFFEIDKITQLNDVALRIMPELGIEVYDLNAVSVSIQHLFSDGIHFSQEGSDILATAIASEVLK